MTHESPHPRHRPPLPTPPSRRSFRRRAGFTIIEVGVAATFMVLVISSAILVMQSGFKALDTARNTTLATQIIQSEMERIRMLSWTDVQRMDVSADVDLATIFPQNTELERKVLAQMQRTFSPLPTRTLTPLTDYSSEIIEITVTVTWKGIDGINHSRSTKTRYCKDGLYTYYFTVG